MCYGRLWRRTGAKIRSKVLSKGGAFCYLAAGNGSGVERR